MKASTIRAFLHCLLAVAGLTLGAFTIHAADANEGTLTKVGDLAPAFSVTTLDGKAFDLAAAKGKVVVVNFFATWCGPCMAEMPELEQKVWQRFKSENFAMIAVGREHTNEELAPFPAKRSVTFPVAGDPKRAAYAKYATQFIPRSYVIGRNGRILFQSVGYEGQQFAALVKAIEQALASKP